MKEKIFTIENIYFIILIAIITFWLTMVTAKGSLTNNRRKWWKRLTERGRIACYIGLLLALILALQEFNNQRISYNNNIDLKNAQDSSATMITQGVKKGVKTETDKLFENLTIAFKKQGLQYDSIKNTVTKIKDSVKTTIINGEPPLIEFVNIQIIDSSYFRNNYTIRFTLKSLNSVSYNTDLIIESFGIFSDRKIDYMGNVRILSKTTLPKEISFYQNMIVEKDSSFIFYAFRLRGFYFKHDKTKITIDKFYTLEPKAKKDNVKYTTPEMENDLRNYIKKKNIK
ncbi:hypothetical protein [Flavobacterium ginsenosidimutans]|uniref:hypothetical protein n=1 Tax=Flavobacterium ginsenosidimutans TaxID=687844 RepID=UPI000DAC8113|nr:hypothetical protein [Flavobacterium ginsenosidimutans]KAF2326660.1 hypothetical protein DM444_22525 [Flavobacterium ginsenosidimutans]